MRTTKVAMRAVATVCALSLSLAGCASGTTEDQVEEQVEEQEVLTWKDAATATEAAEKAGIKNFGMPSSVTVGDVAYTNPTFSYAEGVVQATYERGAVMLYVRKAESAHSASLTDRDTSEFTNKWTKNYGGLDVTSYGFEKDQATLLIWKDGARHYACTYQGLGGEEVWMDDADARALVGSIENVDVPKSSLGPVESSTTSQSTTTGTDLISTTEDDEDEETTSTSSKPKTSATDAAVAERKGYISVEDACLYATDCIDATESASNIKASLVTTGTPHYEVTYEVHDDLSYSYTVLVGATDGAVWDIEETELATTSRRSTTY